MIMAMVAHFDMELHQMDVKTAFLNGELEENIYIGGNLRVLLNRAVNT